MRNFLGNVGRALAYVPKKVALFFKRGFGVSSEERAAKETSSPKRAKKATPKKPTKKAK